MRRNSRSQLLIGIGVAALLALCGREAGWFNDLARIHVRSPTSVFEGDPVHFTCRITDDYGLPSSRRWVQVEGPKVAAATSSWDTAICDLRFTAPSVDKSIDVAFVVEAKDYHGLVSSRDVRVRIEPRTKVSIIYTKIPWTARYMHAAVVVSYQSNDITDDVVQPAPRSFLSRAGPCGKLLKFLGSSSSSSACGHVENGNLAAESHRWGTSPVDGPSETLCVQEVGSLRMRLPQAVQALRDFEKGVNRQQIHYDLRYLNSNSYAFSLAEELLGRRPRPDANECRDESLSPGKVPGWNARLSVRSV